ncbi:MAG: glycosyltransferase, partial [Bdellovibrionales bacterium]|nr:glycosyltransferase [Bdellovibrionales bacterium]
MHIASYTEALVKNIAFLDGYVTLDEDLKPYQFDAVVDLMAKNRTARRYFYPYIKTRVGNSARWFSFLYTKTKFIRRSHGLINEAEYNWQLISALDPSLKNLALNERLSLEDFSSVTPWSKAQDSSIVMPGVTASAVGWEFEKWIELAKLLAAKNHTYILLGPAEKASVQKFRNAIESVENLEIVTTDSFEELIGLLQSARNFIGPSTGITHLAAAVGCAGIALYPEQRSMHPSRWQPYRSNFKVVSLDRKPTPQQLVEILDGNDKTYDLLNPLARSRVSAFVVCCNEERNIRRCLDSIAWCDELVIVDSGSTDSTREI